MLKEMLLIMKLRKETVFFGILTVFIAFLFGFLLCLLLMTMDGNKEFVCIGTVLAIVMLVVMVIILSIDYSLSFNLALSMGRTRKGFMCAYAIQNILNQGIAVVLILLLYKAEIMMFQLISAEFTLAFEMRFIYDIRFILAMIICPPVLGMFLGALYTRFGPKVVVIEIWSFVAVIWTINHVLGDGWLAKTVTKITDYITLNGWLAVAAALIMLMAAFVIAQGKKRAVR